MIDVTYELAYRLTGSLYRQDPTLRTRTLHELDDSGSRRVPVRTDEGAQASLREFVSRSWASDTTVEVVRLTKVTTQVGYEDKTDLTRPEGSFPPPAPEGAIR